MRVWTFILLSSALLSIKLIINYLLPDTPIEVRIGGFPWQPSLVSLLVLYDMILYYTRVGNTCYSIFAGGDPAEAPEVSRGQGVEQRG